MTMRSDSPLRSTVPVFTFLKAEAGATSAPLNVFNRNMGHEEAFILKPGRERGRKERKRKKGEKKHTLKIHHTLQEYLNSVNKCFLFRPCSICIRLIVIMEG